MQRKTKFSQGGHIEEDMNLQNDDDRFTFKNIEFDITLYWTKEWARCKKKLNTINPNVHYTHTHEKIRTKWKKRVKTDDDDDDG